MHTRTLQSVVLVALFVLADCSGFNIGSGENNELVSVLTADILQDFYGGTIASGLTENIVNEKVLIRAYREILANESVTVERAIRIIASHGPVAWSTNSTAYNTANRTRYTLTNGFANVWFSNGTHIVYPQI